MPYFGCLKGILLSVPVKLNPFQMDRIRVRSSNISSIGYEANSRTLEVEFHSGSIYQYNRVPESVYEALMDARSHGAYFNDQVRDNYSTHQVR